MRSQETLTLGSFGNPLVPSMPGTPVISFVGSRTKLRFLETPLHGSGGEDLRGAVAAGAARRLLRPVRALDAGVLVDAQLARPRRGVDRDLAGEGELGRDEYQAHVLARDRVLEVRRDAGDQLGLHREQLRLELTALDHLGQPGLVVGPQPRRAGLAHARLPAAG